MPVKPLQPPWLNAPPVGSPRSRGARPAGRAEAAPALDCPCAVHRSVARVGAGAVSRPSRISTTPRRSGSAHGGRPTALPVACLADRPGTEQAQSGRPAREVGSSRPVLVDGRATDGWRRCWTTPTGMMELHLGRAPAGALEFATDAVVRTPTARRSPAGAALGIVEGDCSTPRRWPPSGRGGSARPPDCVRVRRLTSAAAAG